MLRRPLVVARKARARRERVFILDPRGKRYVAGLGSLLELDRGWNGAGQERGPGLDEAGGAPLRSGLAPSPRRTDSAQAQTPSGSEPVRIRQISTYLRRVLAMISGGIGGGGALRFQSFRPRR